MNSTASVVFFGALHNVLCLTKQVPLLGSAAHKANLVQPRLNIQVSHCWHGSALANAIVDVECRSGGGVPGCDGWSFGVEEKGMRLGLCAIWDCCVGDTVKGYS